VDATDQPIFSDGGKAKVADRVPKTVIEVGGSDPGAALVYLRLMENVADALDGVVRQARRVVVA
jgi:hypothetical protein